MRYMGNKQKLLENIEKAMESSNITITDDTVFCDLFAGTATVADYFSDRCHLIANDNLFFSYAIATGKLKYNENFFMNLGFDPFDFFNSANTTLYDTGFCYNNFAPSVSSRQYFSDENAKKIDYIRDTIDVWANEGKIDENEKLYLIGSLIESVSKVSNVAGVYSAFLKKWDPRAVKPMKFIPLEISKDNKTPEDNAIILGKAEDTIKTISGDILYLDPPYTPTQYISQYHVLETIAENDNPDTHGKGAHRDNGDQISYWSKKGYVHYVFEQLIKDADFKYIVFSYSDAGIMSKEFIEEVMKRYAKPGSYKFKKFTFNKYKSTRAVNREERENTKNKIHYEWLFIIEKQDADEVIYQSPLNYIGGKYDVMNFIRTHLPEKQYDVFYDLFGGGFTVGLNIRNAKQIVYNDINWLVCELLEKLRNTPFIEIYNYLIKTIRKYGLKKANKEAYITFRTKYNDDKVKNPLDLYLLMCYGFEHQFRFNKKHEFNNPCGNSSFNDKLLEKLISYHIRSNELDIVFQSDSYEQLIPDIKTEDFVYMDPPYLISCGAYNDGKRGFNGWDDKQETELLNTMVKLDKDGIDFMLSNMADRNGKANTLLSQCIKDNGFVLATDEKFTKRNRQYRREILVMNYQVEE